MTKNIIQNICLVSNMDNINVIANFHFKSIHKCLFLKASLKSSHKKSLVEGKLLLTVKILLHSCICLHHLGHFRSLLWMLTDKGKHTEETSLKAEEI